MLYDCFTFNNELDLLELRLRTLDKVVDRFVLAEGTVTYQGESKPLYFEENRSRFSEFADRIVYVRVDDFPANPAGDAWLYERHQRESLRRETARLHPGDVMIISDVDEIPDPAVITAYQSRPGIQILDVSLHYYHLDLVLAPDPYQWPGARPVLTKYHPRRASPQALRDLSTTLGTGGPSPSPYIRARHLLTRARHRVSVIPEAGWHFSYCGSVEEIRAKLEAFSHVEYNREELKDRRRLEAVIAAGDDLFGRRLRFAPISIDQLPQPVRQEPEYFRHLLSGRAAQDLRDSSRIE